MRADHRARAGFTMMEIAVALAIIAVMVAVIVPSLTTRIRQASTTSMRTTLDNLLTGIRNYHTNVQAYPQSLQQLSWIPDGNNPYDICGNVILGTLASQWRGPYVSLEIGSPNPFDPAYLLGVPLGDYTANDLLVRTPPNAAPGRLDIQIPGVTLADWQALNDQVDGRSGTIPPLTLNGSDTSGTVRYDVPTGLLSYGMPVNGC